MDTQNEKGQVLIETSLILLLATLIFFAAFSQLNQIKNKNYRYQFSEEKTHEHLKKSQIRS